MSPAREPREAFRFACSKDPPFSAKIRRYPGDSEPNPMFLRGRVCAASVMQEKTCLAGPESTQMRRFAADAKEPFKCALPG
ncbi:hypothetical protein Pden_1239 [Paracoccus denitrificans PD1222]|uniref:Uncharacterized protein n=1 Tax=Paracoccus denitrificans (strain Pd 1222) TaxID=318586 RepID=A1B1F0_PARDP|nr:hypothetical protein Pden_1239 [Paracoccus denitrificans PD1222]